MLQSFAPVIDSQSQVLVLGTMPGEASQRAQQYYAHPRNAFWPIMQAMFGIDSKALYVDRLASLLQHRIALWDVYAKCNRVGSLDSAICHKTAEINSIAQLLHFYPAIHTLVFNGKLAQQTFLKVEAKQIEKDRVNLLAMPSTSPANAALNFQDKLSAWYVIKDVLHE